MAKKKPEMGWALDELGTGDSALLGSMPRSHQEAPRPPCPSVVGACHQQDLKLYYFLEDLGNQPHGASSQSSPHEGLNVPAMVHILKDFVTQISYNIIHNNNDYHLLKSQQYAMHLINVVNFEIFINNLFIFWFH